MSFHQDASTLEAAGRNGLTCPAIHDAAPLLAVTRPPSLGRIREVLLRASKSPNDEQCVEACIALADLHLIELAREEVLR